MPWFLIYRVTSFFPKHERYGLIAQLRRSAVSIATNIVEGSKRKSRRDFAHFIDIADGSLEETKYHFLLARDLKYLEGGDFIRIDEMCDEVGRMLYGFHKKLTAYNLYLTTKGGNYA